MMEIAFELIREAGLRVPSPIGPTIGIVGALILGQAAVQANIISPIIIIVIALSGLSSFIIIDVSMNFAIRMIRFLFIFSAGFMGIYGVDCFIYCRTLLFNFIEIIRHALLCTDDATFLLVKGLNHTSCSNERKVSPWIFKTKRYGQTRKGINNDMKQQQEKLGIREYVSIAILMVGSKATEGTPAILYSHVQNAAWMIPIVSGGLLFIPLLSIIKNVICV